MSTYLWHLDATTRAEAREAIVEADGWLSELAREVGVAELMDGLELAPGQSITRPKEPVAAVDGPYLWRLDELAGSIARLRALLAPA